MWVLQISDLHLGTEATASVNVPEITKLLRDSVIEKIGDTKQLVVTFCGDAIWQGQKENYGTATRFFTMLRQEFNIDLNIFACPGNHDICSGEINRFAPFNRFAREIAMHNCQSFTPENTAHLVPTPEADFILLNSAHHYDHTFGLINADHLERALQESSNPLKIIVTHHNLVPVEKEDRSTTTNAYEVFTLAVAHNVTAILHGHRHMQNVLSVGRQRCALLGVGSLLFPPAGNINNQFNLLDVRVRTILSAFTYKLFKDANTHGCLRRFVPFSMDSL